jgi:hypothetical protein
VRIHLAAEHALELEAAHVRFEALCIGLDVARGSLVAFAFRQRQQLGGIRDPLRCAVDLLDRCRQPRSLSAELLRALLVRPDRGILELAPDLLEPLFLLIVLKETPGGRRCAPRDP